MVAAAGGAPALVPKKKGYASTIRLTPNWWTSWVCLPIGEGCIPIQHARLMAHRWMDDAIMPALTIGPYRIACGRKREVLPVIGFSSSRTDNPQGL